MMTIDERIYGALLGLAYGDATSFPALFHRFQDPRIPRRRHDFLWRTNQELDQQNILHLTLPFTHRQPAEIFDLTPTDDTEFALLSLQALLAAQGEPNQATFVTAWQGRVLPVADQVRSGFSERSAIENLKRGLQPPATGNDNPLHYADAAVARAVPSGLFCAGDPERATALAGLDAQITQAEDGVYAARSMAAAIAVLAAGGELHTALTHARSEFPEDSWLAHGDAQARRCLADAETPEDLALLLAQRVINTVYSYGNAAPETLPAALAIVELCQGDLQRACSVANTIAKSADSLPAMVGALCGAYQGSGVISQRWHMALNECRGLCLPFLQGIKLDQMAKQLAERVKMSAKN
ncbi:MAG: ADP-ribosylglycohydrolase family protein [Chloroflexota bacterium]|nr:ADP-ribosylglycohydrolase family protein [Chloroflexota bacterium]